MQHPDGDHIGKSCMINRQTSYDTVVLTEYIEDMRSSPADGDSETKFDSAILMKDTEVIRGLPIDGDH